MVISAAAGTPAAPHSSKRAKSRIRSHVYIEVEDLDHSTAYYGALFGTELENRRLGYERWIFDNPKIKSAISLDRGTARISHLGLQAEDDELAIIKGRIVADGVTYDAA